MTPQINFEPQTLGIHSYSCLGFTFTSTISQAVFDKIYTYLLNDSYSYKVRKASHRGVNYSLLEHRNERKERLHSRQDCLFLDSSTYKATYIDSLNSNLVSTLQVASLSLHTANQLYSVYDYVLPFLRASHVPTLLFKPSTVRWSALPLYIHQRDLLSLAYSSRWKTRTYLHPKKGVCYTIGFT